jgi:hypothetical protein
MAARRRCAEVIARFRGDIAELGKLADLAESASDDRACREYLFKLATVASSLSGNAGARVEAMDDETGRSA